MGRIEFSINLSASAHNLIKLGTDYENFPKYFPNIQSVRILEKNDKETITEEVLVFSTIIKNKIKQRAIHKQISENELYTEITSGPAKGTVITAVYEKIDDGTKVIMSIDLKLSLKAKFLQPFIKKMYRSVLTGILYKMNTAALDIQN